MFHIVGTAVGRTVGECWERNLQEGEGNRAEGTFPLQEHILLILQLLHRVASSYKTEQDSAMYCSVGVWKKVISTKHFDFYLVVLKVKTLDVSKNPKKP